MQHITMQSVDSVLGSDNKIYGDQRVGFITDFNIGDEIYDNCR